MNIDENENTTDDGIKLHILVLMERCQRGNVEQSKGDADHVSQKEKLNMIVEKINERVEAKYQEQERSGTANEVSDDEYDENEISMCTGDQATVRVINIPEEIELQDLWDLFGQFGSISRVLSAMDETTNTYKGFTLITFDHRKDAEKAVEYASTLCI